MDLCGKRVWTGMAHDQEEMPPPCSKWRKGSRAPFQRRKKKDVHTAKKKQVQGIPEPDPGSLSDGLPPSKKARPSRTVSKLKAPTISRGQVPRALSEVAVLPRHASSVDTMSPLTGASIGTGDDPSATDSLESLETNGVVRRIFAEDQAAVGDGGDSDGDGEGFELKNDFRESMLLAMRDDLVHERDEIEDAVGDDDDNCIISSSRIEVGNPDNVEPSAALLGAPEGWVVPGPPETWAYKQAVAKGEPPFESVDNPGGWSSYTFKAKFAGHGAKATYLAHEMPCGAVPVPKDPVTGKRMHGGYEFHYQGWTRPVPRADFSRGATRDNMHPDERQCELDGDLLAKLGLTKERMVEGDCLFFCQLVFPICDPDHSGIDNDPRRAYYESIADFSNVYAMGIKRRGGTRGHMFRPTNAEEQVNWDGVVARNLNKRLDDSWITSQTNRYDPLIDETMGPRRWLDLKNCMKLCFYHDEKKRGTEGYDPTQKYKLVWDVSKFDVFFQVFPFMPSLF